MRDNINIIQANCTILDALKRINSMVAIPLVLFVLDDKDRMVGTLTDGDIRRALISGESLSASVDVAMKRDFCFLRHTEVDSVQLLRQFKAKKIFMVPILDDSGRIIEIVNLEKSVNRLPIDAVLMAGGKGERLRPLTENTPKPLLKLSGKPIIDYIVEHISKFCIQNVFVTTNYLHEQLDEHFAEPVADINVKTVLEPKFLGTIGSISYIEGFKNDTVLLMNSDAITDINLEDFYTHFIEHNADMSIAAMPYMVSIPYGIFELEGRAVKGVSEKPKYEYYANTGIYLMKKEVLDLIPKDTFFNATDFMELLINKGYNVIRYPFNGTWIDIGSPQEFIKAQELLKHMK